jgi:hypothetical protein
MEKHMAFDYSLEFKEVNFRKNPELNRGGRGEQGVMLVEPYKEEILPHWRFKTPDVAMACFWTIRKKAIRWALQGAGAIRIIKAEKNPMKTAA